MSNIEIYLNVHKDGWVCVSVGCPVGDDDRWACKHFDGAFQLTAARRRLAFSPFCRVPYS